MKHAKVGMYFQVLSDVDMKKDAPNDPVSKYQHAKVLTVVNQDSITVSVGGGASLPCQRLSSPPLWRVNRLGVAG